MSFCFTAHIDSDNSFTFDCSEEWMENQKKRVASLDEIELLRIEQNKKREELPRDEYKQWFKKKYPYGPLVPFPFPDDPEERAYWIFHHCRSFEFQYKEDGFSVEFHDYRDFDDIEFEIHDE